jgi:hypothetical protein
MTAPAAIPEAYTIPPSHGTPFGRQSDTRHLDVVQKDFVKKLLELADNQNAAETFRRWACWWAYRVTLDVAAMPCEESAREMQKAWVEELRKKLETNQTWLHGLGEDWSKKSGDLMLLMGEGLEAAQGDFLSPVLERGLEGTNKWNGQFFTPSNVGHMIGRMVFIEPKPGWIETVSDPCCGCGCLPIAGVVGFLEAGGDIQDITVDMADIDEGSVCAAFIQCTGLGISARAQCMDSIAMEPRGSALINPQFVLYRTAERMKKQQVVTTMDNVLKAGRKRAQEAPSEAEEPQEATTPSPAPEDAPAADVVPTEEEPTGPVQMEMFPGAGLPQKAEQLELFGDV